MADTDPTSNGIVKAKKATPAAAVPKLVPAKSPPVPAALAASPAPVKPPEPAPVAIKKAAAAKRVAPVIAAPAPTPTVEEPAAVVAAMPAPPPVEPRVSALPPAALPLPEPVVTAPEPTPIPVPITAFAAPEEKTMEINTAPINEAVNKTQAMFGDVNERAKGAMEKGAMMIEEMNAFGKGNIEAMVESSKIAAKGIEAMGHDAAAYAKKSYEGATEAMKTLSTVKSPTEFMRLQGDYVRSAFDMMIAETSRSTEAMMKLAGEVAQPISNRVAIAKSKMTVAA